MQMKISISINSSKNFYVENYNKTFMQKIITRQYALKVLQLNKDTICSESFVHVFFQSETIFIYKKDKL